MQSTIVKMNQATVNKKGVPMVNQIVVLVALRVVCVVKVIHTKVTILLKVNNV